MKAKYDFLKGHYNTLKGHYRTLEAHYKTLEATNKLEQTDKKYHQLKAQKLQAFINAIIQLVIYFTIPFAASTGLPFIGFIAFLAFAINTLITYWIQHDLMDLSWQESLKKALTHGLIAASCVLLVHASMLLQAVNSWFFLLRKISFIVCYFYCIKALKISDKIEKIEKTEENKLEKQK